MVLYLYSTQIGIGGNWETGEDRCLGRPKWCLELGVEMEIKVKVKIKQREDHFRAGHGAGAGC